MSVARIVAKGQKVQGDQILLQGTINMLIWVFLLDKQNSCTKRLVEANVSTFFQ